MIEDDETLVNGLNKLYDAWDEGIVDEGLESLPLYSNLKPEPARYSSEELIAEGGMKRVSKVFDPKVGRTVAMASLHVNAPKELYEPFLREAYLTSQLDHPNIITIFDILLDEDLRPHFTMELKTGQNFKDLIKKAHQESYPSATELNELLDIFLKICDAMNYAHDKAVIHLDLKPENIQVGSHGEVIVCDWGIGKVLGEKNVNDHDFDTLLLNPDLINTITLQGKIKGTPGYMAPEQAEESDKTRQTDIYTLGAILYSILTGKVPVEGNTVEEILKNTIDGKVIQPQKRTVNILPRSLCSIATKALRLKPKDRFESVNHMQEDVRKFLTGHSTSAEKSGFLNELKLLYLRHKLVCNICLIFLLISSVAINHSINLLTKSKNRAISAKEDMYKQIALKVKIAKEAAPAHINKALAFLDIGDYNSALKHAETAIQLNRNSGKARNLLGLLHFIEGLFNQANRSFREPMDITSRSLKNLSALYINGKYDLSQEDKYVKELLTSNEMTTALFLYWLKHHNKKFQQYAMKGYHIPIKHTVRILRFAANIKDLELKHNLVKKVVKTLGTYKDWYKRRQAVELAMSLTEDESLKKILTSILPDNLAMGQKVKVVGKSITNPESAVDGNSSSTSTWSTSSAHASIEVDMGTIEKISRLGIHFRQDHDKAILYRYFVETSTDGENFTRLIDQRNISKAKTHVVRNFKEIEARFIRLTVNCKSGVHISEFEVFR